MFEDILEELAPIAEKEGISLKLGGDPGLEVKGDPVLLNRALANLIENGIHYNHTGGFVEITACKADNPAIIEINHKWHRNPEGQQSELFERFYRCRSRDYELQW